MAVDAATGKYLWHFQALHHDLWDYDLPLTTLVDVKKDGRAIPAIAVMSKASLLFLLDRVTGKPIYEIKETPVPTDTDMIGEAPSPTQPMSVTPPLGRTSFEMSELANLTPQQKDGCDKIIKSMNIRGAKFLQPQRADSGVARFPGSWGGIDWSHAAFDPKSGHLCSQHLRHGLAAGDGAQRPTAPMTCATAINGSGTRSRTCPARCRPGASFMP